MEGFADEGERVAIVKMQGEIGRSSQCQIAMANTIG